jgi:hypothetical protein
MKLKHLLLLVAFAAIAVISCQKQETPQTPESVTLITQPDPKGETVEAGTRAVTIAATCDWRAVSNDAWISVSPDSGDRGIHEVILSFSENTTGAVRQGSVTFSAGSYSETFKLTQNAK